MPEKMGKKSITKANMTSSNYNSPAPIDIQLTMILDKEKHRFLTFEKNCLKLLKAITDNQNS